MEESTDSGYQFFDRGMQYRDTYKFREYTEICKKLAEISGISLAGNTEFSVDRLFVVKSPESKEDTSLYIPKRMINAMLCLESAGRGRYYEYVTCKDPQYRTYVIACLVTLKQLFPKTKLSLDGDIEAGIALAEKAVNIDQEKLFKENVDRSALLNTIQYWQTKEV